MKKLQAKQEGMFSIVAALIVVFSAMWDPIISVIVSLTALIVFGVYKLRQK